MIAGRVLATQQARDAARQLLALTGSVKDRVGRVLQQGGVLADPQRWDGGLAGKWRNNWGQDANRLRRIAVKLDQLEHTAQQVIDDIFKADSGPPGDITGVILTSMPMPAGGAAVIPEEGTIPAEVARWWQSRDLAQQQSLISEFPAQIGSLDGIPATARDQANRTVLNTDRQQLQGQLAGLEANQPPETVTETVLVPDPYTTVFSPEEVTNPDWVQWQQQVTQIQNKLAGIQVIDQRLHDSDSTRPPAFLLGFDTQGNGRAIIAINNPDTARNVITYVPGTGSGMDRDIRTDINRSDQMVVSANRASGGTTADITSSITWVGYDAPQSLPDATSGQYAENAETSLHNFEVGLRTTHDGEPSRNTIIGHSYGSTAVGFTMRDKGLPVNDVIFVGSPGVGVNQASDLHIDPSHVYVGLAGDDPIRYARLVGLAEEPQIKDEAPWALALGPLGLMVVGSTAVGSMAVDDISGDRPQVFGRDPSVPQFGASQLPTDPGGNHSQYWDQGTPSLNAIGQIAVGQQPYDDH